jgi:hypothetical protein
VEVRNNSYGDDRIEIVEGVGLMRLCPLMVKMEGREDIESKQVLRR